jgi:hypothetical protein
VKAHGGASDLPVAAALGYARGGWAVLPCHEPRSDGCSCGTSGCASPGKHPRTPHGLHDASARKEVITGWWRRWPQANVAVRTGAVSGLVVVDVDPPHGGHDSLDALIAEHGPLPPTLTVGTGGGGRHLYFVHPGEPVANSAGSRLGPGLDVRGDSGYVLAPPSRHASGGAYYWLETNEIAPPPNWLLARLRAPERPRTPVRRAGPFPGGPAASAWAQRALTNEVERVRTTPPGQRNSELNRAAFALGQLVGGGHLAAETVSDLLTEAGMVAGLGAVEVKATVRSGLTAGQRNPRHPAEAPRSPAHGCGPRHHLPPADVDLRVMELPGPIQPTGREPRIPEPGPPLP